MAFNDHYAVAKRIRELNDMTQPLKNLTEIVKALPSNNIIVDVKRTGSFDLAATLQLHDGTRAVRSSVSISFDKAKKNYKYVVVQGEEIIAWGDVWENEPIMVILKGVLQRKKLVPVFNDDISRKAFLKIYAYYVQVKANVGFALRSHGEGGGGVGAIDKYTNKIHLYAVENDKVSLISVKPVHEFADEVALVQYISTGEIKSAVEPVKGETANTKAYLGYLGLKKKHQDEVNKFPFIFAFNTEQLHEVMREKGLEPHQTNELISIGHGGFILKKDKEAYIEMGKRHQQERKERNKYSVEDLVQMFVYELRNHEYGYTGDPTDTLEALDLTMSQIKADAKLNKAFKQATKIVGDE